MCYSNEVGGKTSIWTSTDIYGTCTYLHSLWIFAHIVLADFSSVSSDRSPALHSCLHVWWLSLTLHVTFGSLPNTLSKGGTLKHSSIIYTQRNMYGRAMFYTQSSVLSAYLSFGPAWFSYFPMVQWAHGCSRLVMPQPDTRGTSSGR